MPELLGQLVHHGVAASSTNHVVEWVADGESSLLIYASSAVLNLACRVTVDLANGAVESLWSVNETLRTTSLEKLPPAAHEDVITCIATAVRPTANTGNLTIVCGFSSGRLVIWQQHAGKWTESNFENDHARSVTVIDAHWVSDRQLLVVSGTSSGATLLVYQPSVNEASVQLDSSHKLLEAAICTVNAHVLESTADLLLLIGTAAPRHNKIHVFVYRNQQHHYVGSLHGHEDWITCFDWRSIDSKSVLLASGSQDYRIRLWKFTSSIRTVDVGETPVAEVDEESVRQDTSAVDDESSHDEEEEEDGEARMEIVHSDSIENASQVMVTTVTLEALLLGHESSVTSVHWHPNPEPIYGQHQVLISSSMDRSIFLWTASAEEDGIWTPLTRVGSAGGILGGPVGASLLGYCRVAVEPVFGRCLVGHAYGGALHVWSLDDSALKESSSCEPTSDGLSLEERASLIKWRATPCVTGHFGSVADICWEAERGDYLLSVGKDQTCRMWAPVGANGVWIEVGRPQVHGYDLTGVTSLSSRDHPHLLVTGADEKELRVFDAPKTTLRVLKAVAGIESMEESGLIQRVDRAYIPSLGLTNKANADDRADEDGDDDKQHELVTQERLTGDQLFTQTRILMERDLGAESIWPEVRKLFGHNSELYCLASTLGARTAKCYYTPLTTAFLDPVYVASSTKARDVEAAAIRLWSVHEGKCAQVLAGGHKSTVATMAFSPDGQYLASSGKDRRLCLWKRHGAEFSLAWAKDTAHKRIIWSVHFCPFDATILASGSRDGCIKIWCIDGDAVTLRHSFAPSFVRAGKVDAVTALAFAPRPSDNASLLAVGLESGRIELWSVPGSSEEPVIVHGLDAGQCHVATVTKLAWKPMVHEDQPLVLASSSTDHGVRIFQFK